MGAGAAEQPVTPTRRTSAAAVSMRAENPVLLTWLPLSVSNVLGMSGGPYPAGRYYLTPSARCHCWTPADEADHPARTRLE